MRIVLDDIRDHIDYATRHALHARPTSGKGGLEQGGEILRGLAQSPLRLSGRRGLAIQRRRAGPRAAHPCERAPNTLHVRDDGRDRTTASAWRRPSPEGGRQDLHEILIHQATLPECLEELALDL
jgi:hypothetical protein